MKTQEVTDSPVYSRLVAGYADNNADYRVLRPKGTSDYLIILTHSGAGQFKGQSCVDSIGKRTITVIPPGTPHDYGTASGASHWQITWVHCRPWNHMKELLNLPVKGSGAAIINIEDPAIWQAVDGAFEQAYRESLSRHSQRILWSMNALERGLLHCNKIAPKAVTVAVDKRIEKSVEYMLEHLAQPLKVSDLADIAGLSVSRFAHLFAEHMSTSPQRYLEQKRLDRARDLLACTSLPIMQIASELGFSDQFYFSRRFRQANGMSPTAFRGIAQSE